MKNKRRNTQAQAEEIVALTENARATNLNAFETIPPGVQGLLPRFRFSDSFEEHKRRVDELRK